jgi:AcrR family transcriptional regulator
MPPKVDPRLERRILSAAERLWRARGEDGLTLRAVAREARTSTPTVYRRFRNKQALRLALGQQFRMELTDECISSGTPEEFVRRYLRFAERHPNEYRLLWSVWAESSRPDDTPRPIRAWLLSQLASRFGGEPKDHLLAYYALMLASHGAGMLLSGPGADPFHEEVRQNFAKLADALLRNAQLFRE